MLVAQARQVRMDHSREQLFLDVADNPVAQTVHQSRLTGHGQRTHNRQCHNNGRHQNDQGAVMHLEQSQKRNQTFVLGEQKVDGRFQKTQQGRRQAARKCRQSQRAEEGRFVMGQIITPDPLYERIERLFQRRDWFRGRGG